MSDLSVHFSSATPQWGTPQAFFDKLDAEFHFQTDVCAEEWNAKCVRYFTPEMDGLKRDWSGMCFCNPPYGRQIFRWVEKAYRSACEGSATVVCLLPARTDTRWWWDYCVKGEIRFIKGRLKFGGKEMRPDIDTLDPETGLVEIKEVEVRPTPAPFPSAVVIFHAHLDPGGIVKWGSEFPAQPISDEVTR